MAARASVAPVVASRMVASSLTSAPSRAKLANLIEVGAQRDHQISAESHEVGIRFGRDRERQDGNERCPGGRRVRAAPHAAPEQKCGENGDGHRGPPEPMINITARGSIAGGGSFRYNVNWSGLTAAEVKNVKIEID